MKKHNRQKVFIVSNVNTKNLFVQISPRLADQARGILKATYTHSKNLASFVFLYKLLTTSMEKLQSERLEIHSFIAAFIGGYFIWGNYNKVNEQVRRSMYK